MENTPDLYDTLGRVLSQQANGVDRRHLQTLAWMMVGLLPSGVISLTAWLPVVVSRARYAHSTVRRCRRGLDNDKIAVVSLSGPFIEPAWAEWGAHVRSVALDTALWWHTSGMIRRSVSYRGRAVPLGWCVLNHGSAQGGSDAYQALLDRAASWLSRHGQGVFLADRGVADPDLMRPRQRLGWHWRLRRKARF